MNNIRSAVAFVLIAGMPSASFAQPETKIKENVKSLNLDIPLAVGEGFDLGGFLRKDSPFDKPQLVQGGVPTTMVDVFLTTSSKGLYQASGFDMRVSVRTPFGGGGGGDHKLDITQITEGQVNLVVVAEHVYGTDSLPDGAPLKKDAQVLLNGNPRKFAELYGTHFVKEQQRIARVVYVITTNSWSEKTVKLGKTVAEANGGFAGWGGGLSISVMDDLKDVGVKASLTVTARVIGGDKNLNTLSDFIKGVVVKNDVQSMKKGLEEAIPKIFAGHGRNNAGAGAMVMQSYTTIGWDAVAAMLWSDAHERRLEACSKLLTEALSMKEVIETTRKDLGIPNLTRGKLESLSLQYYDMRKDDGYIKELRVLGRKLMEKDHAALVAKFPDAPRLDQETEAALFKRYAGILERLERVEAEKNEVIEVKTRQIKSTDGQIVFIGGKNTAQDIPGKEKFTFSKKHARYEVFVTDIDITYPGKEDHSEIQSMRIMAEVVQFKEPTDTVEIEYRLFVKSEPKKFAFKGTAKLIVIGY